jgi:hypothetical protein
MLKQFFVYFKIEDYEDEKEGSGGAEEVGGAEVPETKGGKRRNKKQYKARGGMESNDSSEPDSGIFRDVDSVNGDEPEPSPRINIQELKEFIKSITQNDTFNRYVSKLELSQLQGQNLTATAIFAKKQIAQKGNPLQKRQPRAKILPGSGSSVNSSSSDTSELFNGIETGSSSEDSFGMANPLRSLPTKTSESKQPVNSNSESYDEGKTIVKTETDKMGGGKRKTKKNKRKLIKKRNITKKNRMKSLTKKRKQKGGFMYEKTKSRTSLTTPVTRTNTSTSSNNRSRKSKR